MNHNYKIICSITSFVLLTNLSFSIAKEPNSPLTKQQQSIAKRGNSYAGSGKADKAQSTYQIAIDQAVTVEQCQALVKDTEHFGSILVPVRRNCLIKALSVAKTNEDYFQIILTARQCQLYEITKQCIDALIARAKTADELLDLAHKSLSMALSDVAHTAMEKLYMQIMSTTASQSDPSQPLLIYKSRLAFAEQAKLMAMEDLMRKAIKEILDQEQTTHGLCALVPAIEPLELPDLQRKILRKAVYQVQNIDDCREVYEAARRLGQQDIVDLAGFKGRKMKLIQQANEEQQAIKDQQQAAQEEEELKQAEQTGQAPPPNNGTVNKAPSPSGPGF